VVTTLLWYRLGENDPGAANGVAATNTIDNAGAHPLPVFGQASYTSDVAYSASSHVASSLSMRFTNSAYALTNSVASTLTDNFGIECWVKPVNAGGVQVIAFNGNSSLSGWGLIINGSTYMASLGGQVQWGTSTVVPNTWAHLALVRNNGTATFYVNGIPEGTNLIAPNPALGAFALAAPPESPTSEFFTGELDEARIFTFAPGQFAQSDLLVNHNDLVITLADDGTAGSLRGVLASALNGDKITFLATGTITLTNGELPVTANVNIAGPGPASVVISGNRANRAFNVSSNVQVQMSGLAVRDCVATSTFSGAGGAIYNAGSLTLSNCVISNCVALVGLAGLNGTAISPIGTVGQTGSSGGGIYNVGTLSLTACTLANNSGGAGGIGGLNFGGGQVGGGNGGSAGAIYNAGNLGLSGCTFTGNSAGAGGSGTPLGIGGTGGAVYNTGTGTVTLCTLDGNFAGAGATAGSSGGIYNSGGITVVASTITRNSASVGGGLYNTSTLNARNCLIASNSATSAPDGFGAFTTQGHNLIGNNGGLSGFLAAAGDTVGNSNAPINPVIAPLANNGGLTATVALRGGSPAIDAGDDTLLAAGITTDQRGLPRRSGAHVDIGAYEALIGTAPTLTAVGINSNQMFGFSFTNTPHAAFTVLSSTNVKAPLSNWTVAGFPIELSAGQFQFTALSNGALQQFYTVRSP
jgi:hypothetical protein